MAKKAKLPKTKWGDAIGCRGPRPAAPTKAAQDGKGPRRPS
jgi:hypothetical protein